MNDAQTILKMIEAVDPSDKAQVAETCCRVWCYLNGKQFLQIGNMVFFLDNGTNPIPRIPYCTSRDALKAIRPEGWLLHVIQDDDGTWTADMRQPFRAGGNGFTAIKQKTEELAELRAVIHAIAHDRQVRP